MKGAVTALACSTAANAVKLVLQYVVMKQNWGISSKLAMVVPRVVLKQVRHSLREIMINKHGGYPDQEGRRTSFHELSPRF